MSLMIGIHHNLLVETTLVFIFSIFSINITYARESNVILYFHSVIWCKVWRLVTKVMM